MKITDVKKKATELGINPGKMKKADLIRAIQAKEGYTACFGKGTPSCPYLDCCFREDCFE